MISPKMQDRLNEHLNAESYSAYLYFSMAAYSMSIGLRGFAHWLRVQAKEELDHVMRFFDYIHDQQGRATLKAIAQPPTDFSSVTNVMSQVLAHEQEVTKKINSLVALAKDEKDYATDIFLQWFVTEQIEEESQAQAIVEDLKMVGDSGPGLRMLDRELGHRSADG